MGREPLRRGNADSGVRGPVLVVICAPDLSPARINDDGIPALELEILALERLLEVLDRNLIGVRQDVGVMIIPTFSMPRCVKPVRVAVSLSLKQL
jgi:hypothetical protein